MKRTFWSLITLTALISLLLASCGGQNGGAGNGVDGELTPPASITLQPASGAVGALLRIAGQGFPGDARVVVQIGPAALGAAAEIFGEGMTDKDGALNLAFTIPSVWPDGTPIIENQVMVLVSTEDGGVQGSALLAFEALPANTIQPLLIFGAPKTAPGTPLPLLGKGFTPGGKVALFLGTALSGFNDAPLLEVNVGTDGSFQAQFPMPAAWPSNGVAVSEPGVIVAAVDEALSQDIVTVAFLELSAASTSGTGLPITLDPPCETAPLSAASPAALVASQVLLIHQEPSISSPPVLTAQRCQQMQLVSRNSDASWVEVIFPGGSTGWAYANFLLANTPPSSLPEKKAEGVGESSPTAATSAATRGLWTSLKDQKLTVVVKGMPANQGFAAILKARDSASNLELTQGSTDGRGAARFTVDLPAAFSDGSPLVVSNLMLIIYMPSGASQIAYVSQP